MSRELFYQNLRELSEFLKEFGERVEAQNKTNEAEFKRRAEEREADLKKLDAEFKKRDKKLDAEFKRRDKKLDAEFKRRDKKLDAMFKRRDKKLDAEFKRRDEKLDAEFKRRDEKHEEESAKRKAELDAMFKRRDEENQKFWDRLNGEWGKHQNSIGEIAEQYFYNSFKVGKANFFGEKFDEIRKKIQGLMIEDEYDILLINGKSIALIEVKYKAHENDIKKVLRKVETFRVNFPYYANHKVYLGLASLAFYEEAEKLCKEKGIAVIKQVGDTLVMFEENIKAY